MTGVRLSELVIVGWCGVAALVALMRPLPASRRIGVLAGTAAMAGVVLGLAQSPPSGLVDAMRNLAPALWVLAAYRIASRFFLAPDLRLERWLLATDDRLLGGLDLESRLTRGPRWFVEWLEVAYLAVYVMLPLGAWAAWNAGGHAAVDRYWLVVFPAEASCYLALAWLQTRPPRDLEPWVAQVRDRSAFRRTNEFVLHHGSHRMNTIPSGHAAGAVAVALALAWLGSGLAVPFALLAAAILVATVVGRYHFTVDTVTGALVAVANWLVARAVPW
jgi:membrane-associated phospholipid phosphatase